MKKKTIFNPTGKKRITIKECFEPLQFIETSAEFWAFLTVVGEYAQNDRVDYFLSMLSSTQQQKYYCEYFTDLNKSEEIKALIRKCFVW